MAKFDLHIHSNYSDGSDTLNDLIEKIKTQGVKIFALTDHDTIDGCLEIENLIPSNIKFIRGIELTCKAKDCKCHILGYNYNPHNKDLLTLIEQGKVLRKQKLETRIEYLKEKHGIELTQEELDWLYSRRSVVKMHIANVLVNRKLADNNIEAMKKYLDGCSTGNSRFDGETAIKTIKNAGGVPVWAHPLGGEGERHLSPEEFLPKLNTMIACGIKGLECYYSRYTSEETAFLINCAEKNNLYITGGSDYHGKNKDIPLAKLNRENIQIDSSKINILQNL